MEDFQDSRHRRLLPSSVPGPVLDLKLNQYSEHNLRLVLTSVFAEEGKKLACSSARLTDPVAVHARQIDAADCLCQPVL